jgi:hypothetical protein
MKPKTKRAPKAAPPDPFEVWRRLGAGTAWALDEPMESATEPTPADDIEHGNALVRSWLFHGRQPG